jgi:ribosomal protein L31
MKKGIHPIKYNVNIITTKKNAYQIPFVFNINKLKMEIDPYTHIIYNKLLNINVIKQEGTSSRLRLFKLNK